MLSKLLNVRAFPRYVREFSTYVRGVALAKTIWGAITLDSLGIIPTIMKIDVEGHEMSVFKGAQELLIKHRPVIIAEVDAEPRGYLVSLGYNATLLGKINYLFTKES